MKMLRHAPPFLVLFVVFLLVVACESEPPSAPYTGYLEEEITPCTPVPNSSVDPCELDAPPIEGGIGQSGTDLGDEPSTIREMLDDSPPPSWVPHLVVRGTYLPGTMRCTTGDIFRPPSYLRDELDYDINPSSIKCYTDVRANAYVLGSGPPTLTVMVFRWNYWDDDYTSSLEEGQTEQDLIEKDRQRFEGFITNLFPGREHMLFLGPDFDLSSEAWRLLGYWDVQRREDGTVVAIHPERDLWLSLQPKDYQTHSSTLEMELAAFTQAVTTANQARVAEYGGRIGTDPSLPMLVTDTNQLRQYYTAVGAYDHPDGPPAQPPPPYQSP